jgi:DNA-binding NtrC family response regulator
LVEGPTGSGKELVAQEIHAMSNRVGPIVAINVCAISETMFEDAMFGHVRGSFSGAIGDHAGHLLEADKGTVFLDEIGSLQLSAQVKLLRALETGRFRPVGARSDRCSDFRLIAATNVPVSRGVTEGRFREDLAYRLSGNVVRVPALTTHAEDIPMLAQHFASLASAERGITIQLSSGALTQLATYAWPGNVRQLRQVVNCAVAFARSSRVEAAEIAELMAESSHQCVGDEEKSFEQRRMLDTLEACGWDVSRTANSLGVHPASIYRRARRLGIDLREGRAGEKKAKSTSSSELTGRLSSNHNADILGRA